MKNRSIPILAPMSAGIFLAALPMSAQEEAPIPGAAAVKAAAAAAAAAENKDQPEFPPAAEVLKGYEKVVSTTSGEGFYNLYVNPTTQHMLAELPRGFAGQKHFIALTVASGEEYAGLQAGDLYVYWRQYGKRLALIQPQLETRSTGDDESKASVKRLFTDRVILDTPILTMVPKGGPVVDFNELFVNNAAEFFGRTAAGINSRIVSIAKAKTFPENTEVAFEVPIGNVLRTLYYSIRLIQPVKDFKPRIADERVGYFTTSYMDFGKFEPDQTRIRYINRWNLEKADSSLKLSPPKEPIVFYIEHTTPIRYRRWVADGLLKWNKAFEKVGIANAIEVNYQDAKSGAHMDKDPEDARYNFIRWLNNGIGTAIGPSRVNPETGQILDADIILTDGWIRHWWTQYNELLPELAMEGYGPETLNWLERNPRWDPRLRLATPKKRMEIMQERSQKQISSALPAKEEHDVHLIGKDENDGLSGRISQVNGLCMAANCKTHGLADMHMALEIMAHEQAAHESEKGDGEEKKDEEKKEQADESKEQMLDGIPESFIGPLLVDLVAHEVGHTLGLRHNFKGSSVYNYDQINSDEVKGQKAFASSVMDYLPVNMRLAGGQVQGDYAMIDVGAYDMWAIEYGYTSAEDLKPILARAGEPELQYATDEDTSGPDPLARRYDFAKDPLPYAEDQMRLVKKHRDALIEKFVKDGDSWSKARRGYLLTLAAQTRTISMMSNWVGGAHVYRYKKGDPNSSAPIEVVPAEKQRAALQFVINNALNAESFGLTPELLNYMSLDKWWDEGTASEDTTWPVHDRVLGIQASALTALMNPTTLQRIYDNEFRIPSDQDTLTLPELLATLSQAVWKQLDQIDGVKQFTSRQPLISSFDRNLQREYIERLTDLIAPDAGYTAATKPVSDLANMELRNIATRIGTLLDTPQKNSIDPYSLSHLSETSRLIEKSLNAEIVQDVKGGSMGGGGGMILFLGETPQN